MIIPEHFGMIRKKFLVKLKFFFAVWKIVSNFTRRKEW